MSWLVSYLRSSVGAKHLMAVTGLALLVFAIVHMAGHLGMFGGPEVYNAYAHALQSMTIVKWTVRGGLLAVFVLHLVTGLRLAALNRRARPVAYVAYKTKVTNLAARTMAVTGVALLVFIAFHLGHFTLGWVQPDTFHLQDAQGRYDAYTMFIAGFRSVPLYLLYLVAMILLAGHLGHGASSWLQSLGWRHPKYSPAGDQLGNVLSVLLFVGYMAPPTAVMLGLLGVQS